MFRENFLTLSYPHSISFGRVKGQGELMVKSAILALFFILKPMFFLYLSVEEETRGRQVKGNQDEKQDLSILSPGPETCTEKGCIETHQSCCGKVKGRFCARKTGMEMKILKKGLINIQKRETK